MTARDRARTESRAQILKALGHPSRLLMVEALVDGPLCVCELTELVGSEMSTVSRHLSQLKHVGLLSDYREGTKIFYKLEAPCALRFLDCVDQVVSGKGVGRDYC